MQSSNPEVTTLSIAQYISGDLSRVQQDLAYSFNQYFRWAGRGLFSAYEVATPRFLMSQKPHLKRPLEG